MRAIRVKCPLCGHRFEWTEDAAAKTIRCPNCGYELAKDRPEPEHMASTNRPKEDLA